ncbi:MAG: IclR family transcriptional regulator [Rhodococcus sp. (in: high G+C Gram-positive bacteria)]
MTDSVSPKRGRRPAATEPVIDRALALLTAFTVDKPSLTLSELSSKTGFPISTVHRLSARLQAWGALERRPDGRFVVGLRLLEVASLAPRGHGLRQVAMPYMGDLAEATHQHVQLAVLEKDEAILVERISHRNASPVHYRVGGHIPLHSTGPGLVLLAYANNVLQDRIVGGPLVREPEGTVIDPRALRSELAEIRRTGHAVFRRSSPTPVLSVAAPIYDLDDRCCAALSVVVAVPDASPQPLVPAIIAAARAVSRELGASTPQWRG